MKEAYNKSNYNHYLAEDINVYIPKNVDIADDGLNIKYSKFLWIESLKPQGVIIRY